MKNVKLCSLVALLLLVFVPSIHAQVVSIDEARTTARQFMQNTIKASGRRAMAAQNPASFAAPFTLATEGEAALYVFNRAGGGYVIVSAESDTQREVLGWSDGGTHPFKNPNGPLQIGYYRGHKLVLVNKGVTSQDNYADLVIHDKIGEGFSQL